MGMLYVCITRDLARAKLRTCKEKKCKKWLNNELNIQLVFKNNHHSWRKKRKHLNEIFFSFYLFCFFSKNKKNYFCLEFIFYERLAGCLKLVLEISYRRRLSVNDCWNYSLTLLFVKEKAEAAAKDMQTWAFNFVLIICTFSWSNVSRTSTSESEW